KRGTSKAATDTIEIHAEQDGSRITVEARVPSSHGFRFNFSRSARLIVSVPATADVSARSGDGSIDLDGVSGHLQLTSGDGGIHMTDITLSNVTGRIGRNSIKGRLGSGGRTVRVRTGDGSINLRRS